MFKPSKPSAYPILGVVIAAVVCLLTCLAVYMLGDFIRSLDLLNTMGMLH